MFSLTFYWECAVVGIQQPQSSGLVYRLLINVLLFVVYCYVHPPSVLHIDEHETYSAKW